MIYFLVALIPLIIPFVAKHFFKTEFTIKEMILASVAPAVVAIIILAGGRYSQMLDTQVINGQVTSKKREEVSCEHSYQCNCTTDSKGNRSCSTCYEHSYDVDWVVNSNVGDTKISRIDRRGLDEPPRWTSVIVGEPFALNESYKNYVKGASATLFNMSKYDTQNIGAVPAYPGTVYDYYRIKRVLTVGTNIPEKEQYNQKLNEVLKVLGPSKQTNIVLVFTNKPREFANTVQRKWLGGKKNDVLVFVGVSTYPKIDWVEVFSWSKEPMVNVALKSSLADIGSVDKVDEVVESIRVNINQYFVRKPMSEFEYLDNMIEPSSENIMWSIIIGCLISLGLTIWGIREDIFNEGWGRGSLARSNRPSFKHRRRW